MITDKERLDFFDSFLVRNEKMLVEGELVSAKVWIISGDPKWSLRDAIDCILTKAKGAPNN